MLFGIRLIVPGETTACAPNPSSVKGTVYWVLALSVITSDRLRRPG